MHRYLTQLCDQLVCLISAKHSRAIVWGEDEVDNTGDTSEYDDAGGLFRFKATKMNEQDENVTAGQGFTVEYLYSSYFPSILTSIVEGDIFTSFYSALTSRRKHRPKRLDSQATLRGDDAGFYDCPLLAREDDSRAVFSRPSECFPDSSPFVSLSGYLSLVALREFHDSDDDVVLCLSETLDDNALTTLMRLGLSTRFPGEYEAWKNRRIQIKKRFQDTISQRQTEMHETLEKNSGDLQASVRDALIGEVLKAFP